MKINCECRATGRPDRCLCGGTGQVTPYPGMAVVYVPDHSHLTHDGVVAPDFRGDGVEWGFVTSVSEEFVFCRYFMGKGWRVENTLRTLANSEATSPNNLYGINLSGHPIARNNIRILMESLGYEYIEQLSTYKCKE